MKAKFLKPQVLAFITVVFWSIAYPLTKYATRAFTPSELGALRYAFGCIVLVTALAVKRVPPPKPRDLPWFLLSGLSGFGLYAFSTNRGIQAVSAATASVINATTPVFTAALAAVILKEALPRLGWAALAVEFAGVLLITLVDGVFTLNLNILWLVLAALCTSSYNLVQRPLRKKGYSPLAITGYSMVIGLLFLSPFLPKGAAEFAAASTLQRVNLAFLGMATSAGAYLIWGLALSRAEKVTQVTNFMFLIPPFSTLLGVWMISEFPTPATVVGCLVIFAGSYLFNRSLKQNPAKQ